MNISGAPTGAHRRSRRGQTMTEFALTLPIVLLLMFGIIEFARIFQAWITLQNSARVAVRAGNTGAWQPSSVVKRMQNYTGPVDEGVLQYWLPCSETADPRFLQHWGKDCDPTNDDDLGLRDDMARLMWITDNAIKGASGLALGQGEHIVGLHDDLGNEINTYANYGTTSDRPGWFHVWICSSRPFLLEDPTTKVEDGVDVRYAPSTNRSDLGCAVRESSGVAGTPNAGDNQYDAGGPGDVLEVVVHFNHKLITPIALADFITIRARRIGVNEAFRSTRAVNLPPQLLSPTDVPTRTFTPSQSPTRTETPTPSHTFTKTFTPTSTFTSTFTPTPDCANISITSMSLTANFLQISVQNTDNAPFYIVGTNIQWRKHSLYPGMFADKMNIIGKASHWDGTDPDSPTQADSGTAGWNNAESLRIFPGGGQLTSWRILFANGPASLSGADYTNYDFAGSTLTFANVDGSNTCVKDVNLATPTPNSVTPTSTPTPVCSNFVFRFESFENNAVVRFSITNNGSTVRPITGFNLNWQQVISGMRLDYVSVGGSTAQDSSAIRIWDGDDGSANTDSVSEGTWINNGTINAGQTIQFWADFDGTVAPLSQHGSHASHFNGSSVVIDTVCPVTIQPIQGATTPTPTFTPSFTPTPTSSATRTPTNTVCPIGVCTATPTRTQTPTPTNTVPPTATFTPSRTPTPSNTVPPTPTYTPSNTPTKTNTPQPTATYTPSIAPTPTTTNTPRPTPTPFVGPG